LPDTGCSNILGAVSRVGLRGATFHYRALLIWPGHRIACRPHTHRQTDRQVRIGKL